MIRTPTISHVRYKKYAPSFIHYKISFHATVILIFKETLIEILEKIIFFFFFKHFVQTVVTIIFLYFYNCWVFKKKKFKNLTDEPKFLFWNKLARDEHLNHTEYVGYQKAILSPFHSGSERKLPTAENTDANSWHGRWTR